MSNQNRNRRFKELKANYLKTIGCLECGTYSDLTFHHVRPEEKEYCIGRGTNNSVEKFFKEASKCVVLCRNCHDKVHASERFK